MSTPIEYKDILPGDTIRVQFDLGNVSIQRTGKVWTALSSSIRTEGDGFLWNSGWEGSPVFELINRPKPPLPTEPGTVILASRVEGRLIGNAPMFLRPDYRWEFIGNGETTSPLAIKEWKLAKVVDA